MVTAQYLLEQIQQEGNGIDMVSRFAGPDGWPPGKTIPHANLTDVLGETIAEKVQNSLRDEFNVEPDKAPDTPDKAFDNLISPPTPGGMS